MPACATSSFSTQRSSRSSGLICKEALESRQVRRLMTVPGVNVICAAIFLAAVGDINRFNGSRQVVAYLGLDPRVYQSGSSPARGGRISKQGSPQARWALVEAARSVAQQPGPLHAFYERLRARKGHNRAVVAVARKLAVLFWCMLTREQDYAHQQPSLTARKLRMLEVKAGQPTVKGKPTGVFATREKMRQAERALAEQAEASYKRIARRLPRHRARETKGGRERDSGARITKALEGQVARQAGRAPTPALRHVIGSRPQHNLTPHPDVDNPSTNTIMPKSTSRTRPPMAHEAIKGPQTARTRDIPRPKSDANSVKQSQDHR